VTDIWSDSTRPYSVSHWDADNENWIVIVDIIFCEIAIFGLIALSLFSSPSYEYTHRHSH
jgi:hypothetical protein